MMKKGGAKVFNSTILLELENVSKRFGMRDKIFSTHYFNAVDSIDLRLYNKEILGVVGESGSGKTTLSECIIGLTQLSNGKIKLRGKELGTKRNKEEKRSIQMIFQNGKSAFNPKMRIYDILKEPLYINRNYGSNSKNDIEIICDILEKVGLDESYLCRFPHELSGGQLQRVGIARAIIAEPSIIICDEPVASLDVSTQRQILKLLYDIYKAKEVSYIFISHDLAVVNKMANRIAVMYRGRIVELAEKRSLYKKRYHPYSQMLYDAIPEAMKDMRGLKTDVQIDNCISRKGCEFESRCKYAIAKCKHEKPQLEKISNNHYVACFQKNNVL